MTSCLISGNECSFYSLYKNNISIPVYYARVTVALCNYFPGVATLCFDFTVEWEIPLFFPPHSIEAFFDRMLLIKSLVRLGALTCFIRFGLNAFSI